MVAIRYSNKNTGANSYTLIGIIKDQNCIEINLFATQSIIDSDRQDLNGLKGNLPLMAAIAKYKIPGIDEVYVVFDGLFLTAVRRPRYLEVKEVLDAAEQSEKVFFSKSAVSFTSDLQPEMAAEILLKSSPTTSFSKTTRQEYFSLLCSIPESQYP